MDLIEAEEIKKRWQEYTEILYKKIFMTQITMGVANPPTHTHTISNHDGVINHLEPDILECEVKWALGIITMNKANGGMKFQLSYLKS